MADVALDEGPDVVGDAPVARVQQDRMAADRLRHGQRRLEAGDTDGGRVALEDDPVARDADRLEPAHLVEAQHLEPVDPAAQEAREMADQAQVRRLARQRRDQALGVEVGDAVDEPLAPDEVAQHDEGEHERRRPGEQHLVRPPDRRRRGAQQAQVGPYGPAQAFPPALLGVVRRRHPHDRQATGPVLLHRPQRTPRRQADEDHVPPLAGVLAGEAEAVLADRAEVRRQPVAQVDEAPGHRRGVTPPRPGARA